MLLFRVSICLCVMMMFKNIQVSDAMNEEDYPLVGFDDYVPFIHATTQKTYVTTIGLIQLDETSVFNPDTFIASAISYYSKDAGLLGFVTMDVLKSTQINNNLILVTYEVRYSYFNLLKTPKINDAMITDTIGNYDKIRQGIQFKKTNFYHQGNENNLWSSVILKIEYDGSGTPITEDFEFEDSDTNFDFTGVSLCQDDRYTSCNASYARCVETLDGVDIMCSSPCKDEYCENDGACKQNNPQVMPVCLCSSSTDDWYLGEHCHLVISFWMIILSIVLFAFTLAVAIFMSICCCVEKHKNKKKEKLSETFEFKAFNDTTNLAFGFDVEDISKKKRKNQATQTSSDSIKYTDVGVGADHYSSRALPRNDDHKHRRHRSKTARSYRHDNRKNKEKYQSSKYESSGSRKRSSRQHRSYEKEKRYTRNTDMNSGSTTISSLSTIPSSEAAFKRSNKHTKENSERHTSQSSFTLRWLPVKKTTGISIKQYNSSTLSQKHNLGSFNSLSSYELESMI